MHSRPAPFLFRYFAAATAVTKLAPFGVPKPVTLSHPGPVVSELSVPKVSTFQRVEIPLNSALTYSVVLPKGAASESADSVTAGLGGMRVIPVTL